MTNAKLDTPGFDWRSTIRTMVLGGLWLVLPMLLGFLLLAKLDVAEAWLGTLGQWAIVAYAVVFALTSGLGLLPTYAQALAGGWIFGAMAGTGAALVGFVGGAIVGRLVAACVAGDEVEQLINRTPKAAIVRDALLDRSPWGTTGIITLLRFPPNSPFALTNLALTSCRAPWLPYLVGTGVGMLPRTALVVGLGAAGASTGATSLGELLESSDKRWMMLGGIAVTIVVLFILAAIGRRALERATGIKPTNQQSSP